MGKRSMSGENRRRIREYKSIWEMFLITSIRNRDAVLNFLTFPVCSESSIMRQVFCKSRMLEQYHVLVDH